MDKDTEKQKLRETRAWIRGELDRCVAFWQKHGIDRENGGVYTCLDRAGEIYSTDKSVWMQGRCAWTFSRLCRLYGKRPEWMEAAKSCLNFLEDHCINRAAGGRLYFTVTADGRPLRQRRYFYSETFYSMANAEYYGVTGERVYLERARRAYETYWALWHGAPDPVGMPPKVEPATRTGRTFGNPMICLNMTAVLADVDPERAALYAERAAECVNHIFRYHVHPELHAVLENVGPNGEARLDFTDGRVLNPGHAIEGVWFILEYAKSSGKSELVEKAAQIFDWSWKAGWDKEYGGLLYFTDACGKPTEAYEHDMKLWWPHNEILISSLMLWRDTGKKEYLDKFYLTLDYCKKVFADPVYGEWYGYLRRDGKPTEPPTKGSTYKGPFHLPRMLMKVDGMIGELLGE